MKISIILVLSLILITPVFADNMAKENYPESRHKYKHAIGSFVMIDLRGSPDNGKCDAMGIIWKTSRGKYYVNNITCGRERNVHFVVEEKEIIDVFVKEDFETGGRYGENNIFKKVMLFFRNKTKDHLPCMRNDFEDKEELCEKNELMFH